MNLVNVIHLWERCDWFGLEIETAAGEERTSPPAVQSSPVLLSESPIFGSLVKKSLDGRL